MVSEMGLTLWYEPKALTEDPAAERDSIPRGIFQLAMCTKSAKSPAMTSCWGVRGPCVVLLRRM